MDADEKLTALKEAYAEIILNISKEAAARVIVPERKAALLQHEIKVANEEAVRMMMRLKTMMDTQVSEAEASALHQQKKIDELQAQLQEAEDIVKDLRDELREKRAELDRVKSVNLHPENEAENTHLTEMPVENKNYSHQSDATTPYLNRRNDCRNCYHKLICTCGSYKDLPSIVSRSKKNSSGLFRIGRTQRIRALGVKSSSKSEKELSGDAKVGSFLHKRKRGNRRKRTILPFTEKQSGDALFFGNSVEVFPRSSEDEDEPQIEAGCADISEIECEKNVQKDKGLIENMVELRGEIGFSESALSSDCEIVVEKVDAALNNLESKDVLVRTIKGNVIDHTYQRKRKREAMSGNYVNRSPEEENKTGDKTLSGDQNIEGQKCHLIESSSDSKRLAEVAQQLISLSENKWWR